METLDASTALPDFAAREDVLSVQDAKLARLGRRLAGSAAWRAHFRRAGLAPADLADRQSLAALPLLEKVDARQHYPYPFLTVPLDRVVRFCATSGTTGLPVLFGFTRRDWEQTVVAQLGRIFRTTGIVPGDRVYQGYGYGLWIGGASMDAALAAYGAVNFPVGPGRGELMIEWLRDHAYTVTTMSPLWMMSLVTLARRAGIDPRRDWHLRVGLFGGQSVSASFRHELEAALPAGFAAHDIYGTTEAGGPVLGVSCEHSRSANGMHLIMMIRSSPRYWIRIPCSLSNPGRRARLSLRRLTRKLPRLCGGARVIWSGLQTVRTTAPVAVVVFRWSARSSGAPMTCSRCVERWCTRRRSKK